jgi:hydrogenase maturation protease
LLRIVGIGSPHGDDQVGWRLVHELSNLEQPGFSAHAVSSPIDLLDRMDDCDALIVIDACDAGHPPGTVFVREWPAVLEGERQTSSHALGVDSTLHLAKSLGKLPPRVLLFGVQASRCEPSDDMSPALRESWSDIVAQLHELISGAARGSR